MKMLAEYLDSAIKFETLAAAETDAKQRRSLKSRPKPIGSSLYVLGRGDSPWPSRIKGRAVARSSGLGRTALVFDDNDVVDLLRIAIEREGANPPLLGTTALIAVY